MGIYFYDDRVGSLKRMTSTTTVSLAYVWIKTDSNPVLRRNKIIMGVLEENDISNNALTGECVCVCVC